jgi:hypothetical protein
MSRIFFCLWLVRSAVPFLEAGWDAVFPVAVMTTSVPRSVPEQPAKQEPEQDEEEQREEAEQTEWPEEKWAIEVWIGRHASLRRGEVSTLGYSLSDPKVVGIYSENCHNSQKDKAQEYSENNSTVHHLLLYLN